MNKTIAYYFSLSWWRKLHNISLIRIASSAWRKRTTKCKIIKEDTKRKSYWGRGAEAIQRASFLAGILSRRGSGPLGVPPKDPEGRRRRDGPRSIVSGSRVSLNWDWWSDCMINLVISQQTYGAWRGLLVCQSALLSLVWRPVLCVHCRHDLSPQVCVRPCVCWWLGRVDFCPCLLCRHQCLHYWLEWIISSLLPKHKVHKFHKKGFNIAI